MKKILLIFLILTYNLFSQIALSPNAIFIDPESRSGQLTLTNRGSDTKQVEIYFKFGYPVFDSLGIPNMIFGDSLPLAKNSLNPFVKVFPKKLVLEPNKEQTVRFLLKNTGQLPDGSYWTRVVIKASPMLKQADTNISDKITGSMVFVTESNTIIVYEKGKVSTDLKLQSINTQLDSQKVNLMMSFSRGGNSPFWGTANINIYDKNDDLVDVKSEVFPVYTDGTRRFAFDKNKFKGGDYSAEIFISAEHPDIKNDYKIKIKPIEKIFKFNITLPLNE